MFDSKTHVWTKECENPIQINMTENPKALHFKVSASIKNLIPYQPGKPIGETKREFSLSQVTKLASNENPLGMSPLASKMISDKLSEAHRYPDPSCLQLAKKLAPIWGVAPENLAFGNGSNELIDLIVRIFCEPNEAILTTPVAFVAYRVCAQAARVSVLEPSSPESFAKAGFEVDWNQLADLLDKNLKTVRIVFLPNPNNPTGVALRKKEVRVFLEKYASVPNLLFVFDEAYHDYVNSSDYESAIKYMSDFPQVVVLRTFSKIYGMGGFRLGAMVAHPDILNYFHRVRNPFNINFLAQEVALATLDDHEFLKKSKTINDQGLQFVTQKLTEMGLNVTPSQGNFVLFETPVESMKIHPLLLQKGIILRPVQNYGLPRHMRFSIGLPAENQLAIQGLQQVFSQLGISGGSPR